jgi:WD40 repeat protein
MPLYLPNEAVLVCFRVDEEDADAWIDLRESLRRWNLNLFDDGPDVVLNASAPIDTIRKRPDYVSDHKVWVFTDADTSRIGSWFFHNYDYPNIGTVECCMGTSVIASDRDDALAALGETYLPVHLLWHVWKHEGGDLPRLARAALDGDEKSLPVLADAFTDANHPLAAAARFVAADVLGVSKAEGTSAIPLKEYPRTLGLLPDGSAAFVHQDTGYVRLLSLPDGKLVRGSRRMLPELKRSEDIPETALSTCARFLAMSRKGTVACWRVQPWGLLWRMERPEREWARPPVFSPDGTMLGAPCLDKMLRVWDVEAGDEIGALPCPKEAFLLNLTNAGWAFLTADGRFGLWGPRGAARVKWWPMPEGYNTLNFSDPKASPDGTRLVGWQRNSPASEVILVDVTGKKVIASEAAHGDHRPQGFTPDGGRFFTRYQKVMRAWDGHTGEPVGTAEAREGFDRAAFSADGCTVIGWCGADPVLRAMPIGRPGTGPEPIKRDIESTIPSVAISPDGKQAAVAASRIDTIMEASTDGKQLKGVAFQGVTSVAYSPDGLLAGRRDGVVSLRKGAKARWSRKLGAIVRCVAASPAGGRFAAGLASGATVLLDATGSQLWPTFAHRGAVTALAFSQTGELLSAGEDGLIYRIDTDHGEAEVVMDAGLPLSALATAPEGGLAAAVVPGKKVVLFGAGTRGQDITSLCPFSVCFLSANVLAVGCWGEVVILRLPGREVVRRIPAGQGEGFSVAWSSRNNLLVAGGWDRQLRMFRLGPIA